MVKSLNRRNISFLILSLIKLRNFLIYKSVFFVNLLSYSMKSVPV